MTGTPPSAKYCCPICDPCPCTEEGPRLNETERKHLLDGARGLVALWYQEELDDADSDREFVVVSPEARARLADLLASFAEGAIQARTPGNGGV